jgi:succinate-acetate transporter protein
VDERGLMPGSNGHLTSLWTNAGMVETDRPMPNLHGLEAEHQAVIAEPAPVALFGFAIGTLLIGLVFGGAWPTAALIGLVPALLWFAGVGQFIAGLFSLARGSTMGATAFCSFGMGNVIAGSYIWMQQAGLIPPALMNHQMLALGLFCFAYIAAMLTIAALRANWTYVAVLATLTPGYALAGVQQFGGSLTIGHIGGWFLVASAILAFYAAGAIVVNSQWCREAVPLGKLTH